jgi:glycosyltransferase involved in cell wall biosynthesis
MEAGAPLVSVVIPCWNQARFLGDALESIRSQSHTPLEIVVVDDGSTDDPGAVVSRYPGVRLFRQPNRGRCAARNAGAARARGQFLVFVDADDRLLPGAIAAGVSHLLARPACALAAGHRGQIDADGVAVRGSVPVCVETPDYLTLLQTNFILTPAVAMFRRSAFAAAGGWNDAIHASEDYELYLRIARRWPISCHHTVVAEYRRHGANTSADAALMLRSTLAVIRMQRDHACARPGGVRAYQAAMTGWWRFWVGQLLNQIGRRWRAKDLRGSSADVWALLRNSAPLIALRIRWKCSRLLSRWQVAIRNRLAPVPHTLETGTLERREHGSGLRRPGEPSVSLED